MRTGKELFNTLLVELNEMGLPGMSSTLDEMYRSPKFLELDPLTAIANLVEPEYQKKMNKRIQSRLRSAHLRGCPQELSSCVDSGDREYLPRGITGTLSTLDFIDAGMNVCILGPSDSGKSYLAKAIGIVACNTYKVEYHHCETLLEEMVLQHRRLHPVLHLTHLPRMRMMRKTSLRTSVSLPSSGWKPT